MWVSGGGNVSAYLADVWYSTDGINWGEATDMPAAIWGHQLVSFNNKMYIIAGYSVRGRTKVVYSSVDGSSWSIVTSAAAFSAR